MFEHEKKTSIRTISSVIYKIDGDSLDHWHMHLGHQKLHVDGCKTKRKTFDVQRPFALFDVMAPPSHLRQVANHLATDL